MRNLTFETSTNFVDYLIEKVFETLHQWPEDYTSLDFNENWAESLILKHNIWNEDWNCLTQEQQSELMDYVVSECLYN
jgi:hypothetical protein